LIVKKQPNSKGNKVIANKIGRHVKLRLAQIVRFFVVKLIHPVLNPRFDGVLNIYE
jgi:hypothetical protein